MPERADLRTYLVLWLGQFFSGLGSALTGFALGLWLYRQTGQATSYALLAFATMAPAILAAPVMGVLVDRWPRRRALLLAHGGGGLATLGLMLAFAQGDLSGWMAAPLVAMGAIFGVLAHTAFAATISQLIPAQHLTRANGLDQTGMALIHLATPIIAAFMFEVVGIEPILLLDLASYVLALLLLLWARWPTHHAPQPTTWMADLSFGWRYIRADQALWTLLLFIAALNFNMGMVQVLLSPLVLAFADGRALGVVMSVGGLGMLVGGAAFMAWGGPNRKIYGVWGGALVYGAVLGLAALRPSVWLVAVGAFLVMATLPAIVSSAQAIWQQRVPSELQGRVFAAYGMIAGASLPLAYLCAGPLADQVFEPAMRQGWLMAGLGPWIGHGPGRGIALLYLVLGAVMWMLTLLASRQRILRTL